ncbi:MAG: LptA/OstA family protein [Chitinispirillaceae bacterium]|jgi:lipopolysaccharide export system protein LptA|nr:LptA/OstA family protein [Chitinispirillaceae bacterium]
MRPIIIILAFAISGAAAQKPSPTLILESARTNENFMSGGEFISILRGDVLFRYDDIRIRSDEATWSRQKGTVNFRKNVRVTRERKVITCDRMDFTKEESKLTAVGRFDYFDSTDRSRLRGNEAEYRITAKTFRLRGNPELVRYDTAEAETLTINAVVMHYFDSAKQATAIDSVRIRKGGLFSTCDLAHYFTKTNRMQLRGGPVVLYDIHRIRGDSINLDFTGNAFQSATVVGNSHGVYTDTAGFNGSDTGLTHIWGDSLYLAVSPAKKLDVLWSVGRASSTNYQASAPAKKNTANGKIMMLGFSPDGNVKKLRIWGSARSTYFTEDDGSRGVNEVSGDSIAVKFANGKASFISIAGSTRGTYYPLPQ